MRLPPIAFTVLDTETTGFVPRVHQVMEFASMRVEGGEVVDTFEQLFAVRGEIPPHIQVLTRIKPEAIVGAPIFEEKRKEVEEHIGAETILVGQNLGFDIGMLKGEGIDLTERAWIDTSMLASLVFPEFRSYSLAYMSETLKLKHEPAHRALGDVRATLELLEKIWERLLELSPEELALAQNVMGKCSDGYRLLFEELPASKGKSASWIAEEGKKRATGKVTSLKIEKPQIGSVQLYEESLDPLMLQSVLNGAADDDTTTHVIAVKNLEAQLRRLNIPKNVSVIHPPFLLLNPDAAKDLAKQSKFLPEEALLTLKLAWFQPRTRDDVSLHGNEKDVWNGKLACTDMSDAYVSQFKEKAGVYLLDHRQLLSFLAESDHAAHEILKDGTHVIVDDASMLEDTATRAFGHECSLDSLRAASNGDETLTSLTDLLTLWIEKIRGNEDVHYITKGDLDRPETRGLRSQVGDVLATGELPDKTREQLIELAALLEPAILGGNLTWAECRMNGSLFLHAAPALVESLLKKYLYERFATTLLVPRGFTESLPEIVPKMTKVMSVSERDAPCNVTVLFPEETKLGDILKNPTAGKTIILVGSKRTIEQVYIDHAERLEAENVTLICQGLSGGQGRMESEFLASTQATLWLLTAWMYEGTELPADSADHLVIESLPFDHPGHPIFGARKNHHANGFEGYALPRLECRLFRLLRTFCRERTNAGDVTMLDARIREKAYGRRTRSYLEQFGSADLNTMKKDEGQMKLF